MEKDNDVRRVSRSGGGKRNLGEGGFGDNGTRNRNQNRNPENRRSDNRDGNRERGGRSSRDREADIRSSRSRDVSARSGRDREADVRSSRSRDVSARSGRDREADIRSSRSRDVSTRSGRDRDRNSQGRDGGNRTSQSRDMEAGVGGNRKSKDRGNTKSGRKSRKGNQDNRIIQIAEHRVKKNKEQKNKFSIKMQKKLAVLYMMVLLAFSGLVFRLAWITRENGARYQKQVLSQQKYESSVLPFRRGDIVDAKGTRLATSEKVYNLVIDAKVMTSEVRGKQIYLEPTLQALADNFDLDINAIREYVTTHKTSSYYVPLKQLTYEQISGFLEAKQNEGKTENQDTKQDVEPTQKQGGEQDSDQSQKTDTGQTEKGEEDKEEEQTVKGSINGVWFEEEYKRIYPYDSLAADVIGFSGRDNVGSYGLEEFYNDTLNGINGREYGYLNDDQALERTLKPAIDGYNIHSTIDANIQMIVEKYLKKFNEEHQNEIVQGNGAENIACIIMGVNTGEILAMAEYPGYNLNDVRNPESLIGTRMVELVTNANGYEELKKTDTYITEEVLANMDSDQLYLNLNNLWKSFCITGTYEPGSTAKTFTVAAALEEGAISASDTFECNSLVEVGGHMMGCHNRVDGVLTLEQAVAKSCNVSMIKISQILGSEAFCKFQQIFNFGLKTNIDLAGEARTASFVYTADKMGPTDLATNSFGQNFNVTMIEMIAGFCSLINGGNYYEPHLVNKITNANGSTITHIEPRVLKQTVSASTSEVIRRCCNAVVSNGTGQSARPAGYAIGGKTGTAETIDPNTHKRSKTEFVVSFLGYAPADDPQIAIYVVVDRPNVEKQSNSEFAKGIVRNILTEVLPYLNIFMTEEVTEAERQELDALQLDITNHYGRPSEGDEEDEGEDQDEPPNADPTGTGMSFPIDPETGYRVDPETGDRYDPNTGFAVDGAESVPNPDLPLNPNL
ncbi:MAG: cell division protein FtsI [Lachnospiraceae bacterium]|nr:cell division protein FtsI [Lachnospiraceae bacterium]